MVGTPTYRRIHHHRSETQWVLISPKRTLLALVWIVGFSLLFTWQRNTINGILLFRRNVPRVIPKLRPYVFNLTDFGGVGDGLSMNTKAFEKAVLEISKLGKKGGGQLNVQNGNWVTAPFNLTSHMTLFLAEDAVILGADDEKLWPLMPPLPSYGSGREQPGPRYGSLIHGQNLTDVVITGHNGTIDGQGKAWWNKFKPEASQTYKGSLNTDYL
ncbi:hypothetical protein IFM89_028522 [Coptis chinensis]|uniref:Polygalacturonase n=1 Tax=Coptis chinensis TaxID=261450 RepID=A0A835IEB9_9MAGN|nr:hypothetical protein IFM89_028522 [Coptis chinensis]